MGVDFSCVNVRLVSPLPKFPSYKDLSVLTLLVRNLTIFVVPANRKVELNVTH